MPRVRVTALIDLPHDGITHRKGDVFAMEARDAAIASRRGQVSLTRPAYATADIQAETSAPEPEIETPKRRRRQPYKRRDMQAE